MPAFNWEDPLNVTGKNKVPYLWHLDKEAPPADIDFIRQQQAALLPIISSVRESADEVLKHIESDARLGGPTLLNSTKLNLRVSFLYRLPDHPHLFTTLGPVNVTDHAVILPAEHRGVSDILDQIFPVQYTSANLDRSNPAIEAIFKSSALIERPGLCPAKPPEHTIVVYPTVLRFIEGWIKNVVMPISDVKYYEASSREEVINRGHTIPALSSPKPN